METRLKELQYSLEKEIQRKQIVQSRDDQPAPLHLPKTKSQTHIQKVEHNHKRGSRHPLAETDPGEGVIPSGKREGHGSSPRNGCWKFHTGLPPPPPPPPVSVEALPPPGFHSQ